VISIQQEGLVGPAFVDPLATPGSCRGVTGTNAGRRPVW
jgi:hypothetical protein